jgi:hypothetical protein
MISKARAHWQAGLASLQADPQDTQVLGEFHRLFPSPSEKDDLNILRHLMKSAKHPDQKDDRQRNSNQPEQKTAAHISSPVIYPG